MPVNKRSTGDFDGTQIALRIGIFAIALDGMGVLICCIISFMKEARSSSASR